jgi:chromosome segregation ATPase
MEQRFDDLRAESRDGHRQIAELESELQEKDTALASATETIKEKIDAMEKAYDERDGLRETLADLTEQHDKFKRKSEILGDRLGSLNASLYSMMDQQNIVLDAMSAREEQWAGLSDLRREKMRELVALEEQETSEEFELKSCLLKQTKEMEAIQAVIAAVRTQG